MRPMSGLPREVNQAGRRRRLDRAGPAERDRDVTGETVNSRTCPPDLSFVAVPGEAVYCRLCLGPVKSGRGGVSGAAVRPCGACFVEVYRGLWPRQKRWISSNRTVKPGRCRNVGDTSVRHRRCCGRPE